MSQGGNCHQPSCQWNALLQLQQVTNTVVSPHRQSGTYMAIKCHYALRFWRMFLPPHPTATNAEISFLESKLIVRTLIESIGFSPTSLLQSEWYQWYVQEEINFVTSCWQPSFKRVRKLVAYAHGATILSQYCEECLGSWLGIWKLGCQCHCGELEICEYLLCG